MSSHKSEAERTAERLAGDLDLDDWSGLDLFSSMTGQPSLPSKHPREDLS